VFEDRIVSKTIWPPRSPDLFPSDFFSVVRPIQGKTWNWIIQGDQKVSVQLTITVHKKTAKIQYFRVLITYHDHVFEDKIISKTIWPPRSPDLFPSDFFFVVRPIQGKTWNWIIQGDQKVSVQLTSTAHQKNAKIQHFKEFQSPTMITCLRTE